MDELKELKYFNADFPSLIMQNTLKKYNIRRVLKKQKGI